MGSAPNNSRPNTRSFWFSVGDTLGLSQVGPFLDEILVTCLVKFPIE